VKKEEIQVKIFEYQEKISKYKWLLKKGVNNPSELRNAVIDYRIEMSRLQKQLEVC
jgi:hypothetical protein